MTKMIVTLQVDTTSIEGVKEIIEAAPAWLEEVTSRDATHAEKMLFAALLAFAEGRNSSTDDAVTSRDSG